MFAWNRAASDNRLDCMVIAMVSALIAKVSWGIQAEVLVFAMISKGFQEIYSRGSVLRSAIGLIAW